MTTSNSGFKAESNNNETTKCNEQIVFRQRH